MNVWSVKFLDYDTTKQEYKERYTSLHTSSRKARRAAIEHITLVLGEEKFSTNGYSKNFYTLTSGSQNAHCIINKQPVW